MKKKQPLAEMFKAIRRASRQAEIDAGMVGRFRSRTVPDKKKKLSKEYCRKDGPDE